MATRTPNPDDPYAGLSGYSSEGNINPAGYFPNYTAGLISAAAPTPKNINATPVAAATTATAATPAAAAIPAAAVATTAASSPASSVPPAGTSGFYGVQNNTYPGGQPVGGNPGQWSAATMTSSDPYTELAALSSGQDFSPQQALQIAQEIGGTPPSTSDPAAYTTWFDAIASQGNYNNIQGLPLDIPYAVGTGAQAPTAAQAAQITAANAWAGVGAGNEGPPGTDVGPGGTYVNAPQGWTQLADGRWQNSSTGEISLSEPQQLVT